MNKYLNIYKNNDLNIENPIKILNKVYEYILFNLNKLDKKELTIEEKITIINNIISILEELSNGQLNNINNNIEKNISIYLYNLYLEQIKFLFKYNLTNNKKYLKIVKNVIETLKNELGQNN